MPIGGRIFASPVSGEDIPKLRRWFFAGWVLVVGVLPWLFWWNPGAESEFQFRNSWIQTLVILTIVSVPIGWLFGYKLLFAPLFTGMVLINKPKT